ncbi:hypothetical protein [Nocardia sp. NPDC005978]|uniref:hypothetical protein n=1 Tax=unclassified Nocardia TaxID=2637762 RepID=UPI0033A83B0B
MATGVGLRIADDESVVAVLTGDDATLPVHYIVRESVLHMSDDGDAVLGGDPPESGAHSIRGFVTAVGDPAGMPVDEGEAYRAEDLMATAAFCLINLAADLLEGPAEFYATHPTGWPEANVRALREALDYLGLKAVVLVSERDLPQSSADDTAKSFAHNAARAALAAVLATPAGVTPPDPTASTQNSAEVTDILPAVSKHAPLAQAYSAAIPVATTAEPVVAPAAVAAASPARDRGSRGPYIIAAAAALIGLLLGGLGVATVLRPDEEQPGPPRGEVASQPSMTAGAVPPLTPAPDAAVPPVSEPAEPPPATTTAPATTAETAPPTAIPDTTPPSTTRPPVTTQQYPPPLFELPTPPPVQNPWPQYSR